MLSIIIYTVFPFFFTLSQFTVNVLKYVNPSVIFSAHDHRGMDYVGTRKTGRSTGNVTFFTQNKPEDGDSEFIILKKPNVPSLESGKFLF